MAQAAPCGDHRAAAPHAHSGGHGCALLGAHHSMHCSLCTPYSETLQMYAGGLASFEMPKDSLWRKPPPVATIAQLRPMRTLEVMAAPCWGLIMLQPSRPSTPQTPPESLQHPQQQQQNDLQQRQQHQQQQQQERHAPGQQGQQQQQSGSAAQSGPQQQQQAGHCCTPTL